ncbi:MAG: hypothetical protein IH991_09315 [Planctomycetes bacterium]|nr:hypothetical protein [Planctomycetota bacterium]
MSCATWLKRRRWLTGILSLGALAVLLVWLFRDDGADPRLRAFVRAHPPVDVIFTSRSDVASLVAAPPEGAVYSYPGQGLWQSREGRLRRLSASGKVYELTWGKELPDGGTLIDVMSPSVSLDGDKVVFAGRKSNGHGHFRLYEVDVDGGDLRQLTGGIDDPGCTVVPPMRYGKDGKVLSNDQRRKIDFDDIDPVYLTSGRIAFISTRVPDLGRGHARRASHLWVMNVDGTNKFPMSANRNSDRWPFLLQNDSLAFSLWSRNTEVVTADLKDAAYDELKLDEVEAVISRAKGGPVTIKLKMVKNQPGYYVGSYRASETGQHTIVIPLTGVSDVDAVEVDTSFDVTLPNLEASHVSLNEKTLRDTAEHSNGKYFHVDEVDELLATVPNRIKTIEIPAKPVMIFSPDDNEDRRFNLLLIAFVVLLGVEWSVRKACKLL